MIHYHDFHLHPSIDVLKKEDYSQYINSQSLMESIKSNADNLYEQAKEKGYLDGLEQSKLEQSEHMFKLIDNSIQYLADIEQSIIDIVQKIVKKILHSVSDEELTVGLVRSALQYVRNEKHVVIKVAPSQKIVLKEKLNELLNENPSIGFLDVVADATLKEGDCIMESEIGIVDSSLSTQLDFLMRKMKTLTIDTPKKDADTS